MRPYLRTEMVTCFSRRSSGRKAWRSPKNVCEEAKCSRDVETVGARPGCTKNKGFSSTQETNKNKKVISKLGKGLNFTLNADLSKNPKSKKSCFFFIYFRFPRTLKTVIFIFVEIQTMIFLCLSDISI